MRLLNVETFALKTFFDRGTRPDYSILSHTWGDEEVTFHDIQNLEAARLLAGFSKIQNACQIALEQQYQWIWIDTCCINKDSETELSEAIRSMFSWYEQASVCYVYLADVSSDNTTPGWDDAFQNSRWFTRGWTLQELLAPQKIEFYSRERMKLGDKQTLEKQIHERTKIPYDALRGKSLSTFSVSERFSWMKNRNALREEDLVYSLLGIFNIHMYLLYGEGKTRALQRLKREIQFEEEQAGKGSPQTKKIEKRKTRTSKPLRTLCSIFKSC
jgi:hypothetical protein